MRYNFDEMIDRKTTESVKWQTSTERPADTIPLWVADMDFRSPQEVIDAIIERAQHGVFGYMWRIEDYYEAVMDWLRERHQYVVERDWVVTAGGIVPAINIAIQTFLQPGDHVLIQRPVYPPFAQAINQNGAVIANNPLRLVDNRYEIDFDDFERKAQDPRVKMFILCNPHNPVGRVWTEAELTRMGDICVKHDVLIFSDEIHQDLLFKGHRHISIASLSPAYADCTITATAPTKSFNIAGLKGANLIIANKDIREKYVAASTRIDSRDLNIFGLVATIAAYRHGAGWLDQVMAYVEENKAYFERFIAERLPMLQVTQSEGTFLLWVDFRALGLNDEELQQFVLHKASLWLNDGPTFGEEGSGFQRINIACPRARLEQALHNLERAIQQLLHK